VSLRPGLWTLLQMHDAYNHLISSYSSTTLRHTVVYQNSDRSTVNWTRSHRRKYFGTQLILLSCVH